MTEKLKDSIDLLHLAYKAHKKEPENKLHRAALAKAFEVSFEYLWKYFKQAGSREGFETYKYMCIWFAFGSHTPLSMNFRMEMNTERGI
jgi:hypothetical protein